MKHRVRQGQAILTTIETQIMRISVHKCSQYLPDRHYHLCQTASDIFVWAKIPLIFILL